MEIIKYPSNNILNYLKINLIIKNPRWMKYIYCYKLNNNNVLLLNLLNNALIKLSKEEYKNGLNNEILKNEILKEFLFIVDNDYPENEIYNYLSEKFKLDNQLDIYNKLFSYVILSTTKCNARCKYCYENKIKQENMSDETLDNIIKLIKINYKANKHDVEIKMFGGEPLYYQKIYDRLFKELKNENIKYNSHIITNGYLINDKLIDKLKSLYNTKFCQITIDGTEENYNKIKNYKNIKNNISPFNRILENIDKLTNNNIKVNIRINFNLENKEDIIDLLYQLTEKYKDNELVYIYTHHIYNLYNDNDIKLLLKEYKKHKKIIKNINKSYITNDFYNSHCMVDSVNNILINSNGDIYKCEKMPKDGIIGNINNIFNSNNLDQNKFENFYLKKDNFKECFNCKLKPYCIRLNICDKVSLNKCDLLKKYELINNIENKILNTYKKYKEEF